MLIEMTVLKVPCNEIPSLESDCQLSVKRYGKCKADGKFSKNASISSGKYRSQSACSNAQESFWRACCPQSGSQPCPRTLGDILNLSIDGEYYLHVHSSGLLPSAFSQQFKHSDRASSALLKGLPKPSAWSCPGHRATVATSCSLNPVPGDLGDKGLNRCVG